MKREKYDVTGMTCSACQARIEREIGKIEGIKEATVSLINNSLIVDYDDQIVNSDKIISTVRSSGYDARINDSTNNTRSESTAEIASQRIKLWLSLGLLVLLFYVSMGQMLGIWQPTFLTDMKNTSYYAVIQLVLTTPILVLNFHYFSKGFLTLFKLSPNMDSLVAIGSAAAFFYSLAITLYLLFAQDGLDMGQLMDYRDNLYFEAAGAILTFVSIGKYLEGRSKHKTTAAIRKLMDLAPKTAYVEREGIVLEIDAADI
ncbi:MAG: cation-translocating P-type ATPase, partial [Bacilli bacterium]|nr:cation-translocating P-type ATPase [Bacilli bacterium]